MISAEQQQKKITNKMLQTKCAYKFTDPEYGRLPLVVLLFYLLIRWLSRDPCTWCEIATKKGIRHDSWGYPFWRLRKFFPFFLGGKSIFFGKEFRHHRCLRSYRIVPVYFSIEYKGLPEAHLLTLQVCRKSISYHF